MTYWIVIGMIFVAILAVALATSLTVDDDRGAVAEDDASIEEGPSSDEHL